MKKYIRSLTVFFILVLSLFTFTNKNVAQSSFNNFDNNPVISPLENSWESIMVAYPHVIFDDTTDTYKMWYAGSNGSEWSIGYATSADGISWSKYVDNPILSWSGNVNEPKFLYAPHVIIDNGIYKMWFSTSPNGTNNFNIGYALSSDGITWDIQSYALNILPESGTYAVLTPSVIKINDSDYRMWYEVNYGFGWKIGYATSTDGINWVASSNNPVLDKSEDFEGNDFVKSSVIYDGNFFRAWYDSYNPGSQINYATSIDGINWDKPADLNPVLTPGGVGGFNAFRIISPFYLKNNNTEFLYYAGMVNESSGMKWKIGVAMVDNPAPTPTPSPTPTPTPSPSPTSTPIPTSTPTPTPTPSATSKVVFIPGLGGSYSLGTISRCDTNITPESWGNWPLGDAVYRRLRNALSEEGYTVLPFYYDWRQVPTSHTQRLRDLITTNVHANEKVHIVAHSMGGLVARAYVNEFTDTSFVDKLLTVGTPHKGAVSVYPLWSAGTISEQDVLFQATFYIYYGLCGARHYPNSTAFLRDKIPSIQSLLPIYDYLKKGNTLIPVSTMQAQNTWLTQDSDFMPEQFGIYFGTYSGNGHRTSEGYSVKDPNKNEIKAGLWLDGKTKSSNHTRLGDGTVLAYSSEVANAVEKLTSDLSHTELVHNNQGIVTIIDFLKDIPNQPFQRTTLSLADEETIEPFTIIVSKNTNLLVKTRRHTYMSKDMLFIPTIEKDAYRLDYSGSSVADDLVVLTYRKNGEFKVNQITKKKNKQSLLLPVTP